MISTLPSHGEGVTSDSALTPWDAGAAVDAQLEAMLSATSGPLDWRAVSASDAPKRWAELREWVDWFREEFGYDHRVVPPCWYRHRALANLLTAIRDHWSAAYDTRGAKAAAAEWHRSLIPLEQRLREWASRTGCDARTHRADVESLHCDDTAAWKQHVASDAAQRSQRTEGERRV